MLFELAERFSGTTPDWWLEQPYAYALYSYLHMQQNDRLRDWTQRMARIEAAFLAALAYNEPNRLESERRTAMAAASSSVAFDIARKRGAQLIADIARGGVLS